MTQVEKVKQICKSRKISIHKLEMDCGFANGYISQLKKGVFPTERAMLIAQYLGIPLDEIMLFDGTNAGSEEPAITPEEREYLDLLRSAEPEARQFVLSVLKRSAQVSGPQE
ncbi:MAG: helix-turn-helix transcriptional regulator [Lachnospiraceae bacterium]|nr:helix-turn-helix transcriptional regulator [Lachnospiraceae bacterium]